MLPFREGEGIGMKKARLELCDSIVQPCERKGRGAVLDKRDKYEFLQLH